MFRKIVIGLIAIVVIVVGALWAAVTFFLDNEMIAEQMKKEVSSRFNRTLVFQGDLKTNFFPKVQLVLPPTTLSFEGSDKPQFTLKGAQIGVAVLPLLSGDVQFDDIVIDGLKGQINAARMAKKAHAVSSTKAKTDSSTTESPTTASFIRNLEVASLEIKNAGLTVYGLQNQKIYAVDSLNLTTGRLGLSGTTAVKFSTNFSEKTQDINGQFSMDSDVTYDVQAVSMSLSKPSLALSVEQKGEKISAELNADNIQYVKSDLSAQGAALTAKLGQMSVQAKVQSAQTNQMQTWNVSGLVLNATDSKGMKVNLSGDFVGEIEAFSLQSKSLKGEIQTTLTKTPLSVPYEGMVSLTPGENASVNLKGTLDNAPWQSELGIKGFSVPNINGYFSLNSIVLDKWLPKESSTQKKTALNDLHLIEKAYAAQAQDLDFLNKANGRFGIHVDTLKYENLTVTGLDTTLALSKGVLSLNNFKANTCSGSINGSAQINTAEKWSLNVDVKGINTEQLIKSFGGNVKFYGKANATAKLSGLGLEKTAILKSANGQLSFSANNSVLKGVSLEKIASAVKSKKVTGLIMQDHDETKFTVLNASATVGNGVLNVRSMNGKSNVAEVSGALAVGLIDNALSGEVSARLATSVDGRRVTVPIKLGGTVQSPSYGIDIEEALKAGVKDVIKEATKDPKRLIQGLEKLLHR